MSSADDLKQAALDYHRLAPTFPPDKSIGQDAVDQIPYLVEYANGLDLSATTDWLRANW